ncbi:MAG: hypothetical protein JO249_14820 [Acidobacteria bacterium]|nr:hypothetical protein [Acidobacteriota bacterium]
MRAYHIPWLLVTAAVLGHADVIHLKNGRTIWADHVRQTGSHVEYEVGDSTYAVPQSLVDRVEAGGVPPQFASSNGPKADQDIPAVVPQAELQAGADLPSKLIRDGHIDKDALRSVEDSSQPEITAAAYFIAGKHEFDYGNFPQARTYLDSALRFQPDSPTILDYYAATLVRMGTAKDAVSYAERATRLAPASADAFAMLGAAEYASDDIKHAVRSWKTSLRLRPDATIQAYLDKAEREVKNEAEFSEHATNHFTLHFEGKQTSDAFRQAILMSLESAYNDLARDLNYTPRESIAVFLFTEQAYFDVTQAPAWTGAVNDGKLRIPIRGVDSVNSDLARVLKHELAHSFINQMSNGRCPQWLHEGIAQVLEPKNLGSRGNRLEQLFGLQQEIPFNALEGGFLRFSTPEAMLAYDESLAAVEFITDSYGVSELPRILSHIGRGEATEVALRTTIHDDYGQLQTDLARYLASKYGN